MTTSSYVTPPERHSMKVRKGPARAALLTTLATTVATSLVSGVLITSASAATPPPYEPDSGAAGTITFYNAAGTAITSGKTTDLIGFAVGSTSLTATNAKASLYGYLPKNGQAPGAYAGELLAGPTTFPIASAPAAVASSPNPAVQPVAGDLTFADLAKDFPNNATDAYAGLYQIRIKTSDAKYLASDIRIQGSDWFEAYPTDGGGSSVPVPSFKLGTHTIAAGQSTKVVITGTPGDTVQVLVKGVPSTTYTVIASLHPNQAGVASLIVHPGTNSSYIVRNGTGSAAAQNLVVKAVQSLVVSFKGRTGTFTGHIAPSVVGRTVSVYAYLVGGHVFTACTGKTVPGGNFRCVRTFPSGGTYRIFAQTNSDKYNAAGRSSLHQVTLA